MPPPCRRLVIERTPDGDARFIKHVRVDHCGRHIFVTEQFLHSADIISVFQQMSSKTVAQRVATCSLTDSRPFDGSFDCFLQIFLRNMMAPSFARARIGGNFGGWKSVLPCSGAIGVAVFAFQGEGQISATSTFAQVVVMNFLHALKMHLQRST